MVPADSGLRETRDNRDHRAQHDRSWLQSLPLAQATRFGPAAFPGIEEWLETALAQFLLRTQPLLPGLTGRLTDRACRVPKSKSPTSWIPEGAFFYQGALHGARLIAAIHGDFHGISQGLLRENAPITPFEAFAIGEARPATPSTLRVGLVSRWFLDSFMGSLTQAARQRGYDCPATVQALRTARPPLLHGWGWAMEWDHRGAKIDVKFLLPDEAATWPEWGQEPGKEWERAQALLREATVPITVKLGGARLGLRSLAQLQPGDCIILDQAIDEPLHAMVGGTVHGKVWPGRLGRQAAIQWESVGESSESMTHPGETR